MMFRIEIRRKIKFALLCIAVMVTITGCEKQRVDAQMEELCKKDGGVNVYERILLSEAELEKKGLPIFFNSWNKPGGGYRFISEYKRLKSNKPTLTRYKYSVIREADNKVLGEYIVYIRIGGDIIWRLGPDSSKACPLNGGDISFLNSIFVKK